MLEVRKVVNKFFPDKLSFLVLTAACSVILISMGLRQTFGLFFSAFENIVELSISVNIISCETIREADGLAMSSRNKNMTTEERLIAGEINKFMIKVKEIYKNKKIDKVPISIIDELNSLKNCKLEYFEIDNLSKHSSSLTDEGDRIFIACWIGKTRIIDNLALK